MKIVSDPAEYDILALVHAVRRDRESWEGWRCLQVATGFLCDREKNGALYHGLRRLVDIYMKDRQGTAFLCGFGAAHLFCKGIPEAVLDTMGRQMQELYLQETGQGVSFTIYDIARDYERFTTAYDYDMAALNDDEDAVACTAESGPPLRDRPDRRIRLHDTRVLLVEDDPVTRWMVRTALKDACVLTTAQDVGKAVAAFQSHRPDMVLLDINLPGGDGQDVMTHIMQADPGAYVVMFSSHDTLENIVATIGDGARGFIAKPFSREKLLHYVHDCPTAR